MKALSFLFHFDITILNIVSFIHLTNALAQFTALFFIPRLHNIFPSIAIKPTPCLKNHRTVRQQQNGSCLQIHSLGLYLLKLRQRL